MLLKYVLCNGSLESRHDISLSVSARVERDFQCFAISAMTIFLSSSSLLIAITTSNAFLLVFKSTFVWDTVVENKPKYDYFSKNF